MAESRAAEVTRAEPDAGDVKRVPKRAGATRRKGRASWSPVAALWLRFDAAVWTLLTRWSTRSDALGVELRALTLPDGMFPLFVAKVDRALELIERYDPRRLRRIRRDISAIAGTAGGSHRYHRGSRVIALSWPGVLCQTAAETAMTIVHEATHARIADRGVTYDAVIRGRIEAACVAQEAAFARRLPGGDALAEQELQRLEEPWWTPEELHRWNMVAARAHELPEWLLRWLDALGRRRIRRAASHSDEHAPPDA